MGRDRGRGKRGGGGGRGGGGKMYIANGEYIKVIRRVEFYVCLLFNHVIIF